MHVLLRHYNNKIILCYIVASQMKDINVIGDYSNDKDVKLKKTDELVIGQSS